MSRPKSLWIYNRIFFIHVGIFLCEPEGSCRSIWCRTWMLLDRFGMASPSSCDLCVPKPVPVSLSREVVRTLKEDNPNKARRGDVTGCGGYLDQLEWTFIHVKQKYSDLSRRKIRKCSLFLYPKSTSRGL